MDSRAEFESFISLPPHEKEISRFPEDGSSAWPGSYKNLIVDLAWETWQASRQSGDGCLHTGTLTVDHHKNDPAMQNVDYAHADGVLEPGVYKLYTHPASAERPSLGQRKADQVGTTIGVLVQTPAGSVAAVTDLGRCTWLNQDVTGAGDEVSVPTHALVYEYDGAVQCLHCGAQWGALPGNPTEPVHCAPAKGGEAVSVPGRNDLVDTVYLDLGKRFNFMLDSPLDMVAYLVDAGFIATPPKADEWIKCSERLPTERCFAFTDLTDPNLRYRIVPEGFIRSASAATHWMPLPDPPKKGA